MASVWKSRASSRHLQLLLGESDAVLDVGVRAFRDCMETNVSLRSSG